MVILPDEDWDRLPREKYRRVYTKKSFFGGKSVSRALVFDDRSIKKPFLESETVIH
jgi:hypothetical protein